MRAATPAVSHGTSRVFGLDLARMVACLGVIWYHTGYSRYNELGYFRIPFFTALLSYLTTRWLLHDKNRTLGQFVLARGRRILIPFAIWLVLYQVPSLLLRGHLVLPLSFGNLLMGLGTIPLWYLPFAFCASLVAFGLAKTGLGMRGRPHLLGAIAAFVPTAVLISLPIYARQWTGGALSWWLQTAPAIPLGVALAFLPQSATVRLFRGSSWIGWAALWLLFAVFSLFLHLSGHSTLAAWLGIPAGVFLLIAGVLIPLPKRPSLWKFLGQCSYGMYLTYFGFLLALGLIGLKGEGTSLIRFAIAAIGSFSVASLLLRTKWGRFSMGMDPVS